MDRLTRIKKAPGHDSRGQTRARAEGGDSAAFGHGTEVHFWLISGCTGVRLNHSGRSTLNCHTLASGTSSPHCEIAPGVIPKISESAVAVPAFSIASSVFMASL